jgi:sugar lactone lactonase YvrE
MLVAWCLPAAAQVQLVPVITTVAGNGTAGYSGDNGPATSAELSQPQDVAVDASGNIYFADANNHLIRKVMAATGIITTVAGGGTAGYGTAGYPGDNGPATSAELTQPDGVAVDASGNIYIADSDRIRKVTAATGIITTVAGNGTQGYSGDNGPATSAELSGAFGVAVDASGNIYIADYSNLRIRKVTVATGIITTVAGNGTQGYSGDNGLATSAEVDYPYGVAVDTLGNIYIADTFNNRVREVSASTGIITTVAGDGAYGYSGDNGAAASSEMENPTGVTIDASGNVYIADQFNNRIRKVMAATGIITTVAGDGTIGYAGDNGPATNAELDGPWGVAVDVSGNLYIGDLQNNRIRKVSAVSPPINESIINFQTTAVGSSALVQNVLIQTTAAETISSISVPVSQGGHQEYSIGTITGCTLGASNPSGTTCTVPITFTPAYPGQRWVPLQVGTSTGNINFGLQGTGIGPQVALTPGVITTVAGNGTPGNSGDNGPAISAELNYPFGVAVDASGNLYISDAYYNNVILKVTATTGLMTTVAGNGTQGYSGDNGPATSAAMGYPEGLALDASGNLYIADLLNGRIRKVAAATGIITTVAGNGTVGYSGDNGPATSAGLSPQGVAVDASGNLYIADASNGRIRKVAAATGIITTVAGNGTYGYSGDNGPATSAQLNAPIGVSVDPSGNIYIADQSNNRIRKVAAMTGIISTVAGDGTQGYSGDGGPATSAELHTPYGAVTDSAGNLYIVETGNSRIRKVAASTGIITTVAGDGTVGYAGDTGLATNAELSSPTSVAVDVSGTLYIVDMYNQRIRKINVATSALTFATATRVGTSDSTDGAQSVSISNIGNAVLTLSVPLAGNNPSIASGFAYDTASNCPQLSTSSSPFTLASGADCTYAVDFTPTESGTNTGSLVLTDNNLNALSPYASQSITLSGTATAVAVSATTIVATTVLTENHAATSFTPVTGSGGTGTLTYSVSPSLPTGLTLSSSTGGITGTPTVTSAATTYTLTVTDANNATATATFSLTVNSTVTATTAVTTTTLTENHAAATFTPVTGSGGTGKLSYSVSPTLPAGLSFSTTTGAITGTPTVTSAATTYTVTVTDANGATSTATFTLTVAAPIGAIPATVTVTPSASTITNLQSVSVTITVGGSSGQATPTGSVTLTNGSYSAKQSLSIGTASFTIPAGTLSAGADTLAASYSGDATYSTSSGTATITVSPVVISVSALSPSPIAPGASATATATLTAGSSYSGTMNMTCTLTGSPTGAQSLPTCSFNPASVTLTAGGNGTTVLAVQTIAATTSALLRPSGLNLWGLGEGSATLAGLLMFCVPSRRRRLLSMLTLLVVVVSVGAIGCGGSGGGGSSPAPTSTPATTAGSYTFTVTGTEATNASITTSTSVAITVQ